MTAITYIGKLHPEDPKFAEEHPGVDFSGDFAAGENSIMLSGERYSVARAARSIDGKSRMFFLSEDRSLRITLFLANIGDAGEAYDDLMEASTFPAYVVSLGPA